MTMAIRLWHHHEPSRTSHASGLEVLEELLTAAESAACYILPPQFVVLQYFGMHFASTLEVHANVMVHHAWAA